MTNSGQPDVAGTIVREPRPETLLLVVVGAGIEAEVAHRPLAYDLAERIDGWQRAQQRTGLQAVVCTDLWYLNAPALLRRPTITIGDPDMNAATAFLASRLPTAFVIEGTLRVQLDLEFIDLQACLWGVGTEATASSIEVFVERYLGGFLESAHDH